MNGPTRIMSYLATETHEELHEYRRQRDVDERTKLFYFKIQEFYWTLTRLVGLGHLHDGSRSHGKKGTAAERPFREGVKTTSGRRPRILIDLTATHRLGYATGIQRVVHQIAESAIRTGDGIPVVIDNGRLLPYYRSSSGPDAIEIVEGDKFLMLDASWNFLDEVSTVMKHVSLRGGENIIGLHDIIPLLYPTVVSPEAFSLFQAWFENIALASDAIVCVSKSTAESLKTYLSKSGSAPRPNLPIGWWRLGSDFDTDVHALPSERASRISEAGAPFFLSVGTLEPRKGYSVALNAFDRLWRSGVDIRYAIVGRSGWQSRALERRIRQHPEFGRRLIWLDDANDADLRHLYIEAEGLVSASFAEGFGLPLVEAAHHGLRVIASDIPPFREVAGEGTRFFPVLDAESLAARIGDALADHTIATPTPAWTWRESTAQLLGLIRSGSYQERLAARGSAQVAEKRLAAAGSRGWQIDWSHDEHRRV